MKPKWIRAGKCEAPLFRKKFASDEIVSSQIDICGLGMFELYINGESVTKDVLNPVWSDYEKCSRRDLFECSHRIYYRRYDVTKFLRTGENVLGIMLGNGWYNQYVHQVAGNMEYDLPKLIFKLKIVLRSGEIKEIVSDESTLWHEGYILFNNIYRGEKHDMRLKNDEWMRSGFSAPDWLVPEIVSDTDSPIVLQTCPPDRIIERLKLTKVYETENTVIYDAGQNISGWVEVRTDDSRGKSAVVTYAEELYSKDNTMNYLTAGWPGHIQKEEYICSGNHDICYPHFAFHGFRFCEISKNATPICACVVHSDVKFTAEFECDNAVLNWLFDAYRRTQLNNMHMGVPSDCPTREKLGYTGDGQITCDGVMLMTDGCEFYRKWIYDILDCQDVTTGHIHHTAPAYGTSGGGPGGWGCAVICVPYYFYKHYGDVSLLREAYPYMIKWIKYMKTRTENGLVVREEDIGWFLGEWCTPDDVQIPPEYVNNYFFIRSLRMLHEIAKLLHESFLYEKLEKELVCAMVENFYDKANNTFAGGVQGADVFAIDLGLGNAAMLKRLKAHYDEKNSFDTGIFGTYVLLKVLFENGYAETAIGLLTSEKENTFGYMKKHGATTLWERWNGGEYHRQGNSHSHPMFGACVSLLFYELLGLHVLEKEIVIRPTVSNRLNYVCGSVETVRGSFFAELRRIDKSVYAVINIKSEENVYFEYNGKRMLLKNGENTFIL